MNPQLIWFQWNISRYPRSNSRLEIADRGTVFYFSWQSWPELARLEEEWTTSDIQPEVYSPQVIWVSSWVSSIFCKESPIMVFWFLCLSYLECLCQNVIGYVLVDTQLPSFSQKIFSGSVLVSIIYQPHSFVLERLESPQVPLCESWSRYFHLTRYPTHTTPAQWIYDAEDWVMQDQEPFGWKPVANI